MPQREHIAAMSLDDVWDVGGAGSTEGRADAPWHDGPVHSLAHSLDGSLLCSAGADGVVRVWDVARRELLWHFEVLARHLLVAPDARVLYALTDALEVWPLDLSSGALLDRIWAPPRRVMRALRPERSALSPDGRWLLPSCGDATGAATLVDLSTGATATLRAPGAGETHPVGRFSDDGRSVWTLGGVRDSRSERARSALYRFALGDLACEEIRALRLLKQGVQITTPLHRQLCAFSERWLVLSAGREMLRWELSNITAATWLDVSVETVTRVATGDRAYVCAFSRDRAIAVGSHERAAIVAVCTLPSPQRVTALALAPDERSALIGLSSGRVARVDLDLP